jgi:DNA-binding beta-propeller fold protein YncE
LLELGAYGAGNGMFVSPSGVAIDTNLNLFVADTGNHRVQKFLPDDLTSPSTWSFAGWLGSSDPNVPTLGWQLFGSSLISEQEGGFYNPYGVGISNDGHLLVADTNNNRVQVFNSGSGQFINLIGAAGITSGQYNQPLAVIFADEQVVIADSSNARIQISTIAGAYSGEIAPDTSLLTTEPVRIVTDSKNQKVYVLDKQDSSVTVFNMNGEVIEVLGSKGSGREQFYDPEGMAIDSNGSLYIADTGNARVQILSPQGQFNKSFGVYGTGSGQFIKPNAIAVSNDGNYIYVADASLQLIQKFDSQGNFINGWGSPGSGDAGFNYPSGMALDNENNLYVADQNNHRIKKYTSNGDLIGWWGSYDAGAQAFWLDPGSNRTGALSDADGGFDTPTDIAVDLEGNVYVTDSNNFRIQRFNSVQSQGEDAGFQTEIYIGDNLPAIAVDEWGRVYCLNSGKQVLRFEPDL